MKAKVTLSLAAGCLLVAASAIACGDGAWAQSKPDASNRAKPEGSATEMRPPQAPPAPKPGVGAAEDDSQSALGKEPASPSCPHIPRKLELIV
jgi:hypothetical protein